jgi:hypothetical protein
MQMHSISLVAVALFLVAIGASLASAVCYNLMIQAVNAVSSGDRVSELVNYPGKLSRVRRRYKELFPAGRLHVWLLWLEILSLASLGIIALFWLILPSFQRLLRGI